MWDLRFETNRTRKAASRKSELSESPFEETKKQLNWHLDVNVPKYHLTNTMYISSFGWKRLRSTRRSLFSRIQKIISHLLLNAFPLFFKERNNITYLSFLLFFGNSWNVFTNNTADYYCNDIYSISEPWSSQTSIRYNLFYKYSTNSSPLHYKNNTHTHKYTIITHSLCCLINSNHCLNASEITSANKSNRCTTT